MPRRRPPSAVDVCVCSLAAHTSQEYLHCLFHRLPGLPTSGDIVGFSSLYTVTQDDVHPMVGPSRVDQLYVCNGLYGHGFKLAVRRAHSEPRPMPVRW